MRTLLIGPQNIDGSSSGFEDLYTDKQNKMFLFITDVKVRLILGVALIGCMKHNVLTKIIKPTRERDSCSFSFSLFRKCVLDRCLVIIDPPDLISVLLKWKKCLLHIYKFALQNETR